ncbi:DUF6185 family protein [Streptomyces luteireticuli]|uniref:DUF6185 family protein n=1 Tax=Streptomyces luteireticuli TaxID=173858 RepID=UPI003558778F
MRTAGVRRAGRCAALLLAGLVWWSGACGPAHAEVPAGTRAASADCHTERLTAARTEATLRIDNHAQSLVDAVGTMTVRVPVSWPYASALLLSENSADHQRAMRCLLRSPGAVLRPAEYRPHSPQVTAEASWVKVQYDTLFEFQNSGTFPVGPWVINVQSKRWTLTLAPPRALEGAHWDRVEIDPGGLDTSQVTPRPSLAGGGHLVWNGLAPPGTAGPEVTVQLMPPWQRAWVARFASSAPWVTANAAGMTTWWLGTAAIIVFAALRARRQPVGPGLTALEESSSTSLLRWGVMKAVLGVLILLLYRMVISSAKALKIAPTWLLDNFRWPILIGFLAGWALAVTARPRKSMLAATTVVTLAGGLVAAAPTLFGLPPQLLPKNPASFNGALVVMAAAMLWLWLAGIALWSWTLTHDGGLLRPTASPLRLRRAGIWLIVPTALLLGWAVWAAQRHWQRISWLSDRHAPGYDAQYLASFSKDLVNYTGELATWCYSHTWVLTGIAVVALLRARDLALPVPYASPAKLDRLLLAVFFAVVVAWRQGSYAGSQLLASLWLALDIAALYGLLAVGQRRAVLVQRFEGGPHAPALGESITETGLTDLIARARRYRELIGVLRGLDQGQHPDTTSTRHAVEKELSRLHHWRPQGGARGAPRFWLPGEITVVDVALSWGPYAKWWDNARRAALLAAGFGLPGSIVLVWSLYGSERVWMRQKQYFFGLPDIVWAFFSWELAWAGAGLVLGALWRLLPGHRGPARALGLVIAYTLLVALGSLGNLVTYQGIGNVAIGVSLMLLVLTLTGIAMDLETFRSERRLWPSRVQLLLSIYQMRSFSAQIAYLLVQVVALLTVLRFFISPEGRMLK